ALGLQAADDVELVLGIADHLPDIDFARFAIEPDAAVPPAHGIEIALLAEIVDDLHQMLTGNIEAFRYVLNRRQLAAVQGDLDQNAQGKVGVKSKPHDGLRPAAPLPPALSA